MREEICAVAVDAATYALDKLYSYLVPDGLREQVRIGARVLVPFGTSNKRVEGIVLGFRGDDGEHALKSLAEVMDDTPVLTEKQLKLAVWMRERLYCTFFDCVRVMLPSGLWFKRKEIYTLSEGVDLAELQKREGIQGEVLRLFGHSGQALDSLDIRAALGGRSAAGALDMLTKEGILRFASIITQKSHDKTEKMLALALSPEEAAERISSRSKARLDVVKTLSNGEWMSHKELRYMTGASDAMVRDMIKKGLLRVRYEERMRLPDFSGVAHEPLPVLSKEQSDVYEGIAALLDEHEARAALIFGVTGSGKTQVYIRLIQRALEQGKGAVMLVPEIGLTPQLLGRFAALFGNNVAVIHSALSVGERYDSFKKIRSGQARVVLGTRSAVFAPVENLGIIIIDEEHDGAYRSNQTPRYHARDVAKYRAAKEKALIVMGSATPSVDTYYGALQGKYPVFRLTERFLGTPLPEVVIADMRGLAREGYMGIIGPQLACELAKTLEKGKQAILFLNRRGNSRNIGCAICGWVPACPSCSVNMTYHSVSGRAMCHYCGASMKITGKCPVCGAGGLFAETPGTQKVEEELHIKFPSARVLRMDADTMNVKGAHEKLLTKFGKGGADILLGTQMVAKGLDFENVTLVGVLDADQSLYAPDYTAREQTFALITQVVGRAGRRFDKGRAVIQTYSPNHSVILTAARQDYEKFFEQELDTRRALKCPPAEGFTILTAMSEQEARVLSALIALQGRLRALMEGQFRDVKTPVLGPAADPVVKMMGRYRYHLTMRNKSTSRWRTLISGVIKEFISDHKNRGISVYAEDF